jgi:poly-gamma-glutamate synthesis protein (capsule biosynthesis protein)
MSTAASLCNAQVIEFQRPFEASPLGPWSDTLEVCIFGDMMMHTAQLENASKGGKEYGFDTYFQHLESRIKEADIAIANMEYTLAGEPYSGYPAFSAPDTYASYFSELGFDVFLAANNHIFDKGARGAERTIDEFLKLGVKVTGIASDEDMAQDVFPLIIECKGVSIAILNATYGTNVSAGKEWPKALRLSDKEAMEKAMGKASGCDIALVLPHWGTEYELNHSAAQEKDARWFVSHGADAIIGAHPHVVQDMQTIDGIPVFYSLGNAVSNMSAANTQMGMMARLRIVRYHNGRTRLLEPEYELLWCSRPGGYCSGYTVLPVEEFIGTRAQWIGKWEYDKMIETLKRIKKILDNE